MKAWYKKNYERLLSPNVIVRSPEAKLTLQYLHDLAAAYDAGGYLLDRGTPLTAQQIVAFTGLNVKKQTLAIEELQVHGLIQLRGDGTIQVLGWLEDQEPSKEALRKRRQRLRDVGLDDSGWLQIIERQGWKCALCPDTFWQNFTIDHITARAAGGANESGNIQALCGPCNSRKGKGGQQSVTVTPTNGQSHSPDTLKQQNVPDKKDIYTTPPGDKSPSGDGDAPPPWVNTLFEAVEAIWLLELRALDPGGLSTLARYHCYRFANCTRSETANISNATKVAAALASLGRSRSYGDITVAEYVRYAKRVHELRKGLRWFDPWAIKGVVEFESA